VASRVAPVAELDPAEWRRVLATDLDGAFYTARAAIPHVVARRGAFLFISSIGADAAAAGGAPYHVAKAGVNTLTKVLATEVAHTGGAGNCIRPGLGRPRRGNPPAQVFGRGARPDDSARTRRRARGHRACGSVPLLRGRRVDHRKDTPDRRRRLDVARAYEP